MALIINKELMDKLVSSFKTHTEELPVRPLLLAAGAAATAFSIYCFIKLGDGQKRPERQDNKTSSTDPVREQAPEPALVGPTEVLQDQVTEDAIEAKEKIQMLLVSITQMGDRVRKLEEVICEARRDCDTNIKKAVETITQLEEERFELLNQVITLRDTMRDMGDQLIETHLECDEMINEHEQEQEAYSILQEEHNELIQKEELQTLFLAEAEEKHQNALETITQLEEEKNELGDQVNTLNDSLQDMEDSLIESNLACDELMTAYSALQEENDELNKTLIHSEKLQKEHEQEQEAYIILQEEYDDLKTEQKVSLAQATEKHQKAVETITQLKTEKSDLTKVLQSTENRLTEANLECDKLMNEHEKEREAYSILQEEYNELKKTLIHCEELRTISLVETMGNVAQLNTEKSDLTNQVKMLRDTVQDMKVQIVESNLECKNLMNVCEQQQKAYRVLEEEYVELEKTLFHNEELQKASLVKRQKSMEIIVQLEEERSNLKNQVMTLRDRIQAMGNQLVETNLEFDELMNKHEREQEAYRILQKKYSELKKTLIHNEALQTDVEKKHQKAVETITPITQLEEKSDLLNQVYMDEAEKKHQKDVETIAQLNEERTELTNQKFERQRDTHSRLHDENNELKKILKDTEEFLKISLSEAVEKHQKAVKIISQLEAERSELTNQLETLRLTVQDMGNKISATNQACEEPANERVREAPRILQFEKLKRREELLVRSDQSPESNGTTTTTTTTTNTETESTRNRTEMNRSKSSSESMKWL